MDLKTLKTLSEEQRFGTVFSSTYMMSAKRVIVKGFVRDWSYSDVLVYDMIIDTSDESLQAQAPSMIIRNPYHAHFLQFCLSHNLTVQ